jgi:hypothetical protein
MPQALAGAGASATSAAAVRLAGLDGATEGLVRPRFAAGRRLARGDARGASGGRSGPGVARAPPLMA